MILLLTLYNGISGGEKYCYGYRLHGYDDEGYYYGAGK